MKGLNGIPLFSQSLSCHCVADNASRFPVPHSPHTRLVRAPQSNVILDPYSREQGSPGAGFLSSPSSSFKASISLSRDATVLFSSTFSALQVVSSAQTAARHPVGVTTWDPLLAVVWQHKTSFKYLKTYSFKYKEIYCSINDSFFSCVKVVSWWAMCDAGACIGNRKTVTFELAFLGSFAAVFLLPFLCHCAVKGDNQYDQKDENLHFLLWKGQLKCSNNYMPSRIINQLNAQCYQWHSHIAAEGTFPRAVPVRKSFHQIQGLEGNLGFLGPEVPTNPKTIHHQLIRIITDRSEPILTAL